MSNVGSGGLVSIVSITDSCHETVSSSTKFILLAVLKAINFHHGSQRAICSEWEAHRRGGMDLSSGGVRGAGHGLSRKEQERDFPGSAVVEIQCRGYKFRPHAWILCATTKARSSQINK